MIKSKWSFVTLIFLHSVSEIVIFYYYSKNNLNPDFSRFVPMNTTKPLLGVSLATVLVIGIASFAYAGIPGVFVIDSADAVVNDDDYLFIANMNGTVPKNSNGDDFNTQGFPVWGVAWVDGTDTGSNFTGVTIHPNIVDSRQNPDNWHPHTGTFFKNVTAGDVLCIGTLESPHAGIAKNGDLLRVNIEAESSDVTPDTAIAGVSFFLNVNNVDCPAVPVELPGKGLKPNAVSPPLPGLQVLPVNVAAIP